MIDGEPALDLTRPDSKVHLVTDELPDAIALFEKGLDLVLDAEPLEGEPQVIALTGPGVVLHPEPGVLDGIFNT